MKEPSKKNRLIQAAVSAAAAAIVAALVSQYFFSSSSFDKQMTKVASEINANCPVMLDKDTQFDNAMSFPGNIFQYNYTLVNYEPGAVDTNALKAYLLPNIINNVKTNPDMKFMREHKVIMAYYYKDKNGKYLFRLSVSPEQYNN